MNQAVGTIRVLTLQDQEKKQTHGYILCGPQFCGFDLVAVIAVAVHYWPTMKVSHEHSDF